MPTPMDSPLPNPLPIPRGEGEATARILSTLIQRQWARRLGAVHRRFPSVYLAYT